MADLVARPPRKALPLSAEKQMPALRKTIKFLRSIGAKYVGPGPGDHEKWRLPDGRIIQVNRDGKDTDIATIRQLCAALGMSMNELLEHIKED